MKIVGLTGGIGSGKTSVAKMFAELGVPVYIADVEAKLLMNRSKVIKRKLIALFGEEAYVGKELNRPYLASQIFNNKDLLLKMNAIVHPKVASHFNRWVKKQDSLYCIKESAILFENGNNKHCDFVITVIAPENVRIERVVKRDNSNPKKIKAIIKNQWKDEDKVKLSHFVIDNINLNDTLAQVSEIHKNILKAIY